MRTSASTTLPRMTSHHGKMYWVDGEVAAMGSYNLEHAADNHLTEQLVFSLDAVFVARIHKELLGDINEICKEYQGPKDRGFFGNIWFWFLGVIGWLTDDLWALVNGKWMDGLATTFLGTLFDIGGGIKDIFIDAPKNLIKSILT